MRVSLPGKPTCLLGSHDMLVAGSKASRRAHLVWNGPGRPRELCGLAQWDHGAMPSWQYTLERVRQGVGLRRLARAYAYSTRNREIISKPGALDKVIVVRSTLSSR